MERGSPASSHLSNRRPSRIVESDGEDFRDTPYDMALQPQPATPSFSMSPAPARLSSAIAAAVDASDQPIQVQKMAAELEVAEAELKAARLKFAYCQAKEQAEKEAKYGTSGTGNAPHGFE
jgi:hypothetical protein